MSRAELAGQWREGPVCHGHAVRVSDVCRQ